MKVSGFLQIVQNRIEGSWADFIPVMAKLLNQRESKNLFLPGMVQDVDLDEAQKKSRSMILFPDIVLEY